MITIKAKLTNKLNTIQKPKHNPNPNHKLTLTQTPNPSH